MLKEFQCPVIVLPLRCTYDWNALTTAARLMLFIHREKADIVHTLFTSADLWGGAVSKLSQRPWLVSSRRDMGILRSSKHRLAYRALHGMFDRVLAVSEAVRKVSIDRDGLNPQIVKTIHNAIDVRLRATDSKRRDIRQRYEIAESAEVIVSVGNLRQVKGFDILIRAAALVRREFPKTQLVIAGDKDPAEPDCQRKLEALSAALGVADNVRFVGQVDDVMPLLSAGDIFCLFSRSEGFSNALLEAMACGLPCIATRVGGNSEAMADEDSGFLIEDGDSSAGASRILELLHDPSRANAMGARAQRSVAQRFSPETTTAQLVELYESLMANRLQR
jgi:glycosyltransferase involved in cell wall biosynthesis